MLKPLLCVSAMLLFTAAAVTAPALQEGVKGGAKITPRAKTIYAVDCAMCHGESGDGKSDLAKDMGLSPKDLTDPKTLADKSDADVAKLLRAGHGKMPAEDASRAKADELMSLISYIRTLSQHTATAAAAPAAAPATAN